MKKGRIPINKQETFLLYKTMGDWNRVAQFLGVSTTTLRRRRIEWERATQSKEEIIEC